MVGEVGMKTKTDTDNKSSADQKKTHTFPLFPITGRGGGSPQRE